MIGLLQWTPVVQRGLEYTENHFCFFFSLIVGTGVHRASGKGERIADLVSNEET
jgi:hypothetical protein